MKKLFGIAILMMVILACGLPPKIAAQTSVSPASTTNDVAATAQAQNQMSTFVAQTVEAQQPVTTETTAPTAVPPTVQANIPSFTASQWNGSFLEPWGARVGMAMVVQKVLDATFSGKMSWIFSNSSNACTALMTIKGEIIGNISAASEQNRWAIHPDFKSGDTSGTWLRWTQLENVGNTNCFVNTGDWWYAHIRGDGHMIGIRFMNPTDPQPANGELDLTLKN